MNAAGFVVGGALATAAFFGIGAIGDATQTRADVRDTDAVTEIVVHVEAKNYRQSIETGAWALWGTCAATVVGTLVEPGIEPLGGGDFRFAISPTLGHHGRERLLGCLSDLTVDRLRSHVISARDVPR